MRALLSSELFCLMTCHFNYSVMKEVLQSDKQETKV